MASNGTATSGQVTKLSLLIAAENQKPKWRKNETVQQALAKHLDVDASAIYRWSAGSRNPRWANAIRIAAFFGVTVDDVIGWADPVEAVA